MVEYDRINILEIIAINKANASKECDICHYWYFLDKTFKYEPNLCKNVAIVSVKGSNYGINFWYFSKNDAINIMGNSNLNEKRIIVIFLSYIKKWVKQPIIKETEMVY